MPELAADSASPHGPTALAASEPSAPATGANWLSTGYHNVTAMVGAGVLGLPYAFAALGWAGGTVVLLVSLLISMYSFALLVHLHEDGPHHRFCRYHHLCQHAWGEKRGAWLLLGLQLPTLFGLAVTYTVTGGESLGAFVSLLHTSGGSSSPSLVLPLAAWIGAFSAVELLLAQLPSLDSLAWVSGVGAAMSVCYSLGASLLSLRAVQPRSEVDFTPGSGGGAGNGPPVQRFMGMAAAVTAIFFAYGGHNIALEIQATLPFPPTTVWPMMQGVYVAFMLTFLCYTLTACSGYYAFGSTVKANILTSAGPSPMWLLAACNLGVVLHVLASYQVQYGYGPTFGGPEVYSNPLLQLLDLWVEGLLSSAKCGHGPIDKHGSAVASPSPGLRELPDGLPLVKQPLGQHSMLRGVRDSCSSRAVGSWREPRCQTHTVNVRGATEAQVVIAGEGGVNEVALGRQHCRLCSAGGIDGVVAAHAECADAVLSAPRATFLERERLVRGSEDSTRAVCLTSQTLAAGQWPEAHNSKGRPLVTMTGRALLVVWCRLCSSGSSRLLRRVALRVAYVSATCLLACLIPFFGQLMGLIGALGSTPTNFILPCLLWLSVRRPTAWRSVTWWLCWVLTVVGVLVGLLGAVGSLYGIVQASGDYRLFEQ